MQPGDRPPPSFAHRAARAAVLLSSASLAAFLVLRAGGVTGCDKPAAPPETKPAESKPVTPPEALGPAAVTPEPAPQPVGAAEPATPAPEVANPPGSGIEDIAKAGEGGNAGNAAPRYFPASKSGIFIEQGPTEPPQKEPAVQEDAPPPVQKQQQQKPRPR